MEISDLKYQIQNISQANLIKKGTLTSAPASQASNAELRKVAKEMEALFIYQLIKVMRETANSISSEKKGVGYNTYTSLFDMEISRLLAERGLGFQDALIRELQEMIDEND